MKNQNTASASGAVAVAAADGADAAEDDDESRMNENLLRSRDSSDDVLSRELLKLSLIDRNAIQEEIHGVRCLALKESPELLARSLTEFQNELDEFVASKKSNYETNCGAYGLILAARRREEEERNVAADESRGGDVSGKAFGGSHCYALDDPDFRLRFLRCELFDVKKAARRFLSYLDFVHEGWGDVALKHEVGVSDFTSKDSKKLLWEGCYQLLPFRDRSGRRIAALSHSMGRDIDPLERAKVIFYVLDVATRDSVESQRRGAVTVAERIVVDYDRHADGSFAVPPRFLLLMKRISDSIPTRIVAVHNCWPNTTAFHLLATTLSVVVLASASMLRLKFHFGENESELRYKLMTYGIPVDSLPHTETGTIKTKYHRQWIKTRTSAEEKKRDRENNRSKVASQGKDGYSDDDVVECPAMSDVVFRRGFPAIANPGNSRFKELILAYLEAKETRKRSAIKDSTGTCPNNDGDGGSCGNRASDHPTGAICFEGSLLGSSVQHFCDWLIDEVTLRRRGRFLDWGEKSKTWTILKSKDQIRKKVSISIYNATRTSKSKAEMLRRQQIIGNNSANEGAEDDKAYSFLPEGRPSSQQCCWVNPTDQGRDSRKRTRNTKSGRNSHRRYEY